MPKIDQVIHCLTESYEHPIDRLAGAVLALAIYDATNDCRKTKRNNYHHRTWRNYQRRQAREWLLNHGIYWLEVLDIEPAPILEAISGD